MPNYGRYGGPENYYQGGGDGSFDPYTGRLNVGQLIQQFILRKRAEEEQAKQAQWEMQDRAWTEEQRGLQKQVAELDLEAKRREAKDYMSPGARATAQNVVDYWNATAEEQRRMREIDALKKKEIAVKEAGGGAAEKPSDYDKKAKEARALFKAGKISEQELNRVLTGYTGEQADKERKATRNRIAAETRKAIDAGISNKYHESQKDRDIVKSSLGVDLTMPAQYNIAKRMVESDVADEEDYDTIKKYEEFLRFYQEELKPKMKLKELLSSEFYKSLEPELKVELVKWYRLKL